MRYKIIFFIILLLGFFLRAYQLNVIPPALNWDEVSLGYNTYSILRTGQDEWGQTLPLSFRAYGDYKLPGYVYLDVPFIAIFGLNEWAVRIPSALAGVGTILFVFLILKKLSKSWEISLWGMFLVALAPWAIILSRIGLEANLALFLTSAAIYFLLLGLEKYQYLSASAILLGLSIFTYNSSRVVAPLLVLLAIFVFKDKIWKVKNEILLALSLFIIFSAVAIPKALLQDSSARYKWTSILDEGAINRINELRGSSALPPTLKEVAFNKVTYAVPEIFKNYISHFSPDFLFLSGGSNYQFSVPGLGLLYPIMGPFLLLGLWNIFKKREKWQIFILGWLLIAPIPAAITRDPPHALRSLMMIPPLLLITSLGINYCFNESIHWIRGFKKVLAFGLVSILVLSLYLFWNNYSGDYIRNYSWSWQYGYKEAVDYIMENGDKYEKIYITKKYGEPHDFLLFYLNYDPAKYRNDPNLVRYFRSDWYWVDSFDKYIFLNDWEVTDRGKRQEARGKSLLVTSPGNYPEGSKLLEKIYFLDGKEAFDIVELSQVK